MDKIPARNRIILLDTCHSGEVDKEFSADFTIATNNNSQVKTRALKLFRVKNELGYKNTTRLMEELFLDLRKGTGAYIIPHQAVMNALSNQKNGQTEYLHILS